VKGGGKKGNLDFEAEKKRKFAKDTVVEHLPDFRGVGRRVAKVNGTKGLKRQPGGYLASAHRREAREKVEVLFERV